MRDVVPGARRPVTAGIINAGDLAGYRNGSVGSRKSMHVPPSYEAVRELIPEFFALLQAEPEPAVRVALGHVFIVCTHRYFDGNGRMGRVLKIVMMTSGGWPWTVIPVDLHDHYMSSLEAASVRQQIGPLARLIAARLTDPAASKSAVT